MKPLFLLCNDDGIHAPGLTALHQAVRSIGEAIVVAPHVERSASSQAISIAVPLRVQMISENWHAVEGTPADCVMFGTRKIAHKKPNWVLSGINRGGNMGVDTLYSGTVGAAMEGCLGGIKSMAISCHGRNPLDYSAAIAVVQKLLALDGIAELCDGGVLNVNVPSGKPDELRGIIAASLGRRLYDFGMVEGVDPRGRPYFWVGGGGASYEDIPDSDCALLDQGYATVTVLRPSMFDEEKHKKLSSIVNGVKLGKK